VRAQVLRNPRRIADRPLTPADHPTPEPGPGEVRVGLRVCACCRTDLHVVEGDLELSQLPIVPGHQGIGVVEMLGEGCSRLSVGERVGMAWLHWACGVCAYCRRGEENLCERAAFTGWTVDGAYAEAAVVPEAFAVAIPPGLDDDDTTAPLLCAGVIGYRALRRAEVGPGERVALFGFGASAHLVLQVLVHWACETVVVTRGEAHRELARELGAAWTGSVDDLEPASCDRAVVFAPAGGLVPPALRAVRPGGTVALAGIHMTPIPSFDYELLWGERTLRSVANLTRRDAAEFLDLAVAANVRTEIERFPLDAANDALAAMANGSIRGAAVLTISTATTPRPGSSS
jgi:alcohol dehydrogenase, propanol-preferring